MKIGICWSVLRALMRSSRHTSKSFKKLQNWDIVPSQITSLVDTPQSGEADNLKWSKISVFSTVVHHFSTKSTKKHWKNWDLAPLAEKPLKTLRKTDKLRFCFISNYQPAQIGCLRASGAKSQFFSTVFHHFSTKSTKNHWKNWDLALLAEKK